MTRIVLLVVFAVGIGAGRFFVPTHALSLPGTYEAFAHLFVGGLIGAWLVGRSWQKSMIVQEDTFTPHPHHLYLFLLVALTVLEIFAFLHK